MERLCPRPDTTIPPPTFSVLTGHHIKCLCLVSSSEGGLEQRKEEGSTHHSQ